MNKTLIEDKFIIHFEQPFWNYDNGIWTTGTTTFNFKCDYIRVTGGNPLSNFMQEATDKVDNFIYTYFKQYGIKYDGAIYQFRNEILNFFATYYNEFMYNKRIIDTMKDPDDQYIYEGGSTEAIITLNTTAGINYKKIEKNGKEKINYYYNPQIVYKYSLDYMYNDRW